MKMKVIRIVLLTSLLYLHEAFIWKSQILLPTTSDTVISLQKSQSSLSSIIGRAFNTPTTTQSVPSHHQSGSRWENILSPELRHQYQRYLEETKAPTTATDHLRSVRRIFNLVPTLEGEKQVHSASTFRKLLHQHEPNLFSAAQGLPGSSSKKAKAALRHLIDFYSEHKEHPMMSLQATKKEEEHANIKAWSNFISPSLQQGFIEYMRDNQLSDKIQRKHTSILGYTVGQLMLHQEGKRNKGRGDLKMITGRRQLQTFLIDHMGDSLKIYRSLPPADQQHYILAMVDLLEFLKRKEKQSKRKDTPTSSSNDNENVHMSLVENISKTDITGSQATLDPGEEGGPGSIDAFEEMIEALDETQHQR